MKQLNVIIGLAVGLFLLCIAGLANATVLTFEDSDYAVAGGTPWTGGFQSVYGGLNWSSQFGIYYGPGMNANYQAGVVSDHYALFNEFGDAVEITIDSGSFDWNGAWFSSARTSGSINVSGYFNGTEIHTGTIGLAGLSSTWFQADWAGVDRIRFHGSYNVDGRRFQMDNFTINESMPTPEPATMLLFGAGLVVLAGIKTRGKKE